MFYSMAEKEFVNSFILESVFVPDAAELGALRSSSIYSQFCLHSTILWEKNCWWGCVVSLIGIDVRFCHPFSTVTFDFNFPNEYLIYLGFHLLLPMEWTHSMPIAD